MPATSKGRCREWLLCRSKRLLVSASNGRFETERSSYGRTGRTMTNSSFECPVRNRCFNFCSSPCRCTPSGIPKQLPLCPETPGQN